MEFIVNDLSFHGQFQDVNSFRDSINQVMVMRQLSFRFGRSLYCHRGVAHAQVTPFLNFPQAVQMMTLEERRAILHWITQHGPFWEDARNHQPDDWLECNGNIVTETAVGETGWCCLNGINRGLISLSPSNWQFSPVAVNHVTNNDETRSIDVINCWDTAEFEAILQATPTQIASWEQLSASAIARFTNLTFATNAFAPMQGHPFMNGPAERILSLLEILDRFKTCFNADGQRTSEGHEIYRNFFTGRKEDGGHGALFSDSSEREKNNYEATLTFTHPADANKTIICYWHGKVQTPPLRIHFSYPIRAEDPLYIVYVGRKLTI
ncbi:MAG: hypothetical protein HXX11_14840 [Desulfuromonadales bacterium]|nr:hypothetical protein [Desulfuromonadales bacterium]